ncbi:protein NEOXANTHIN-DEFICIENT 1 isoform X2 [Aristolochia californica]|uniref:protein NEOXANTHIN-DEFICIENT 1 isoform X2 n=1 Tax=Aristolochia californica TaxID=171875 RepID=UPI0035DA78C4
MKVKENQSSSGYANGPPWLFRGRALYQLHLVKAKTARAFIPKELKLVEAFGYTLGGFFLARYDDSPAGMFDELVVIAGIVWNPPTSCAWAARVLVNSSDACAHGRQEVGLPSHVAEFSKRVTPVLRSEKEKSHGILNLVGMGSALSTAKDDVEIQVSEIQGSAATAVCCINLPNSVISEAQAKSDTKHSWPEIQMSLPSFSGQTVYNPQLLKYSCHIKCRFLSPNNSNT